MNFKKRVNGSWTNTLHYIHKTDTDTITTLPTVIYPTSTTAAVGLKGQTLQSSIPSPTSPVMPQGTGERTGNLWDEDYTGISGTIIYKAVYVGNGDFTLSTSCPAIEGAAALFFLAGNVQAGASTVGSGVFKNRPRTVASISGYVTIAYRRVSYQSGIADPRNEQTMLNTGSTPLPYEKFGIKIPILSNSTTTNVYLGEVQSTRWIKKLVLTGEEDWQLQSINSYGIANFWAFDYLTGINSDRSALCTHFYQTTASIADVTEPCFSISTSSASLYLRIQSTTASDATQFKTWLAQQYAAGTPVTVWYVLATETTGIVNEPLRKIGDYADNVSGITIPTIAGTNTLSIGTTLQPSEVTVNYKGWHPVADVHERESGQWD